MSARQACAFNCTLLSFLLCSGAIFAIQGGIEGRPTRLHLPRDGSHTAQVAAQVGGGKGEKGEPIDAATSNGFPGSTPGNGPDTSRGNASRRLHRIRVPRGEGGVRGPGSKGGSSVADGRKGISSGVDGGNTPETPGGGSPQESALTELLAAYTERHGGATSQPGYTGKYVLVGDATSNGLGNRLPGFVAGLFLALATDRVLMCKWPELEPFLEAPEGLDFDWTRQLERYEKWHLPEPSRQVDSVDNYTLWLQTDWRNDDHFNLRVVLEINYLADYMVPLMAANRYISPFVEQHFGTGPIFRPLSAFLLQLSPPLRRKVDAFASKSFGAFTVGLQIRRRKGLAHLLPDIRSYADAALALARTHGVAAKDVTVFVATDTQEVEQQVAALLSTSRVVWTAKNMEAHGTTGNPGQIDDALVDMTLLSECTEIVMSYGSSFGSVAAGMGGVLPTHLLPGPELDWNGWGAARRVFFFRGTTSEPCFTHSTEVLQSTDAALVAAWKDGCPHWMQHAQCHW